MNYLIKLKQQIQQIFNKHISTNILQLIKSKLFKKHINLKLKISNNITLIIKINIKTSISHLNL